MLTSNSKQKRHIIHCIQRMVWRLFSLHWKHTRTLCEAACILLVPARWLGGCSACRSPGSGLCHPLSQIDSGRNRKYIFGSLCHHSLVFRPISRHFLFPSVLSGSEPCPFPSLCLNFGFNLRHLCRKAAFILGYVE